MPQIPLEPCFHVEAEVEESYDDEYPLGSGQQIVVTRYWCPTCQTYFSRSGRPSREFE